MMHHYHTHKPACSTRTVRDTESGGNYTHSILLKTAAAVLLLLLFCGVFCGAAAAEVVSGDSIPTETYYTITITPSIGGSAFASPTSAAASTTISLTEIHETGYVFKEWQTIPSGILISNDNRFIMPPADVSIKAVFEIIDKDIPIDSGTASVNAEEMTSVSFENKTATLNPNFAVTSVTVTDDSNVSKLMYHRASTIEKPLEKIGEQEITVIGNAFILSLQDNILSRVPGVNATLSGKLAESIVPDLQTRLMLAQKTDADGWQLLPVSNQTLTSGGEWCTFTANFTSTTNGHYAFVLKPVEIDAPSGTAEFSDNKGMLSPVQESGYGLPVSAVNLKKISGLKPGSYVTLADKGFNPDYRRELDEQHPAGICSQTVISVFDVVATSAGTSMMTFEISVNSGWDSKNIRFIHGQYDSDGKVSWGSEYLVSDCNASGESGMYNYTVTTNGFSPFAIVYAVPVQQQSSSSSSRDYGASVWLPATTEPTPTAEATPEPTQAQPVASPVNQPQQQTSTPAPAAGILAGLGAALVFGLRRK